MSKVLEILVSDILISSLVSGLFLYFSYKHEDKSTKQGEKDLAELKSFIDMKLNETKLELENQILKARD